MVDQANQLEILAKQSQLQRTTNGDRTITLTDVLILGGEMEAMSQKDKLHPIWRYVIILLIYLITIV
ncbi:hypothetical protein THII_3564 [Thioploca ingrica]|uniref:Uncharacterized protein n=1 Tax=Thioploca ingrica TaxID=40754 RepID=A0A090BW24_9GAMM|nr:hypothetical protein THII_3564 [Thioploca ingrica]